MKKAKRIACFCGILLALCMAAPIVAQAEEPKAFTFSDRNIFQQDEEGHVYYEHDAEKQTGMFSLEPDYLLGDVTQDTNVDAVDAAEILKAAAQAGSGTDSAEEILLKLFPDDEDVQKVKLYADIDGDTVIDASDAAKILTYAAESGSGSNTHVLGYTCYYADENGFLQTGWIQDTTGEIYYAMPDYVLVSGWLILDGNQYYLDKQTYAVQTGWQILNEKTYWFSDEGILQKNGWAEIEGEFYYFDETGILQRNSWLNLEDNIYYLDENGICLKGWQEIDGLRYYFDPATGIRLSGWFNDGENQYYSDENGLPVQGWQVIGESSYYFDEAGMMQTGWLKIDDQQYYLYEDGTMATGLITVDDLHYYMGTDGIMQKRQWLFLEDKTYYLGLNGDCLTGWQELTGYTYYFQPDGVMSTGWTSIDGNQYYFYPDNGTMAVNTTIDGITLGASGKPVSEKLALNQQRAQEVFSQNGTSVSALYNYMRSTNRYKYTEATRTLEQIEANGWLYYADYAFTHYYTVCYYMAAKMDFLLQEAGYTCRIVHATHGSGDHYWNQVYIDGSWINYDCTNGYNAYSWDRIIAAGNYIFLGYVTPVYQ